MEVPTICFVHLPQEKQIEIFSLLPIKDVGMGRLVCRQWNGLLRDSSIWKRFYIQLFPKRKRKEDPVLKTTQFMNEVVAKIRSLTGPLLDNRFGGMYNVARIDAIVKLNRVGMMLDVTEAYTEAQKQFAEAKAEPTYRHSRNQLAALLIKRMSYDFEKMMKMIPYLDETDGRTNRVLSHVAWKAINQNRMDEVMNLFDKCKNFRFWAPCIVDLARLLREKESEHQKLEQFTSRFPNVTIQSKKEEGYYYAYTGQLKRAKAIALELKDAKHISAIDVFKILERAYKNKNKPKKAKRLSSIWPSMLELTIGW